MGSNRVVILVIAIAAAIGLMLIAHSLLGRKPGPAPIAVAAPEKPMTQVLVAHRDLPIGARIAAGDVVWQPWPADGVNPAFITDGQAAAPAPQGAMATITQKATAVVANTGPMEAVYGAIVRVPILANEPVVQAKLVRAGQGGFMSIVLHPGMRAVAIPIGVSTGAGGFILPGDRVDVMQAKQLTGAASTQGGYSVQTLLKNIQVLAIDQASEPAKGAQSMIGAVATLEVPAADEEILAKAKAQGEVVLALRSYADAAGASGRAVVTAKQATGDVHIYRAGTLTETTVTP